MAKRLVDDGWHVIGVDNFSSESALYPYSLSQKELNNKDTRITKVNQENDWPEHLKCEFELFNCDIKEFFQTRTDVNRWHFDLVVHLAAVIGGRVMIEEAPLAVAEDLAIDAMMFNWATKTKPKKIIYASSSAAYPVVYQRQGSCVKLLENMIDFNDDFIGVSDMSYGHAKLTGEFLAKLAHEKYGLDITCFRPFSGYGEDQHETYPFPAILKRVINKEEPLIVWSDTIRDFIHIDDCIDGMLQLSEHIHDGSAINLGTGVPTSFTELARRMAKIRGYNPKIKVLQDKPKGVFYRVADTGKARSLGFIHKTSLNEGIEYCLKMFLK